MKKVSYAGMPQGDLFYRVVILQFYDWLFNIKRNQKGEIIR